jgi:hypothetical protein
MKLLCRIARQLVQDSNSLDPAKAMAYKHRAKPIALVIPGNQSDKLLACVIITIRKRAILRVSEACFGVAHANKKLREGVHSGFYWKKPTVDIDNSWRRRCRKAFAHFVLGYMVGIQGQDFALQFSGNSRNRQFRRWLVRSMRLRALWPTLMTVWDRAARQKPGG